MKVLTQLTGSLEDREYREPYGTRSAVMFAPVDGWLMQVKLGGAGLTVTRGKDIIAIPLAEIIALAQKYEPALIPPPADPVAGSLGSEIIAPQL